MLIEWLWKYEYFVILRKMVHIASTILVKNYLIYSNVMLFGHYLQIDFYQCSIVADFTSQYN